MVSTHLKHISQNGNLPQVGVNIQNVYISQPHKDWFPLIRPAIKPLFLGAGTLGRGWLISHKYIYIYINIHDVTMTKSKRLHHQLTVGLKRKSGEWEITSLWMMKELRAWHIQSLMYIYELLANDNFNLSKWYYSLLKPIPFDLLDIFKFQ